MSERPIESDVKYEEKILGFLTDKQVLYIVAGCILTYIAYVSLHYPSNMLVALMVVLATLVVVFNADIFEASGDVIYSDFMETTMDSEVIKDLKLACFNVGVKARMNVIHGKQALDFLHEELADVETKFHEYKVLGKPAPQHLVKRRDKVTRAIEDVKRSDTITKVVIRADRRMIDDAQLEKLERDINMIGGRT